MGSAWTLISLALAACVALTVGSVLAGYTTLAALVADQIFWIILLASAAFLLVRLVDDVMTALFRPTSKTTKVSWGQSRFCSSSRVTISPGRSNSIVKT